MRRTYLVRLGLKLVAYHRAAAKGLIVLPQLADWTSEEHEKVADLLLEDIREENWEGLEKLYGEVGLFPETYFGPRSEISLQ